MLSILSCRTAATLDMHRCFDFVLKTRCENQKDIFEKTRFIRLSFNVKVCKIYKNMKFYLTIILYNRVTRHINEL